MKRFTELFQKYDLRFAALVAALAVYAMAGSPTPQALGLAEISVGVLLLIATGAVGIACIFSSGPLPVWARAGQILLLYGLTVPFAYGTMAGHAPGDILRDIVPFLFLLLPLFLRGVAAQKAQADIILYMMVAAGWIFAARLLLPFAAAGDFSSVSDPQRLANAPTVLLAALLLLGSAGAALYESAHPRHVARAVILSCTAFVPVVAIILINQRASMGLLAAGLMILLLAAFARRPVRALAPLAGLAIVIALGWDHLGVVLHEAVRKTELVGLNMRGQEMRAVLDQFGSNPLAVLFGKGWGAGIHSPATGDVPVTYTHNFFTTYLLKTGLAGMALAAGWVLGIGRFLLPLLRERPVAAVALAAPFLIDITLYASFKSLDFGLLLLVITLQGVSVDPAKRL